MRPFLFVLLTCLATPALAQIGLPASGQTLGFPILVAAGSVDLDPDVTAAGVTSPVIGFTLVGAENLGSIGSYMVVDVSGGMSLITCFALPCSGVPEERDGVATEDKWVFVDGALLPRWDPDADADRWDRGRPPPQHERGRE